MKKMNYFAPPQKIDNDQKILCCKRNPILGTCEKYTWEKIASKKSDKDTIVPQILHFDFT